MKKAPGGYTKGDAEYKRAIAEYKAKYGNFKKSGVPFSYIQDIDCGDNATGHIFVSAAEWGGKEWIRLKDGSVAFVEYCVCGATHTDVWNTEGRVSRVIRLDPFNPAKRWSDERLSEAGHE